MDKERKDILQKFFSEYNGICRGVLTWINTNNKNFKLIDALNCIYEYADGNFKNMEKIIRQLIDKGSKPKGRTQVYNTVNNNIPKTDIINNNGTLELINYNQDKEPRAKGQKVERNPKIFNKDGHINRNYQKISGIVDKIGYQVEKLFPHIDEDMKIDVIQAIRKYYQTQKVNVNTVLKKLEDKKLVYDPRLKILRVPSTLRENKIVVLNENILNDIKENLDIKMTEYKFFTNIKNFLCQLLDDAVNAQPSFLLRCHNLDRTKLIRLLINNNILQKEEQICDTDENGQHKTATMKIRYKVPKKDFKFKLKKLFIKLFEVNLPTVLKTIEDNSINNNEYIISLDEDEGCGAVCDAGTTSPMGATTTMNNATYDNPSFLNKKTPGVVKRNFSQQIINK